MSLLLELFPSRLYLKRIHLHQCTMPSTGLPIVQLPTSLITFPLVIETIRSGEHIRHGEPSVGDLQLGRGDFDQEDDEEQIAKLPAIWAGVEMFNMVIVQLHGSQSTARLLTAFSAPLSPTSYQQQWHDQRHHW